MHNTSSNVITRRNLDFTVVGAGGTGSHIIAGLTRICEALKKLGKEQEYRGRIYDPDIITEANAARQLFLPAEIGRYKSDALAYRMGLGYSTRSIKWYSHPVKFPEKQEYHSNHIIISCVDNKKSRKGIYDYLIKNHSWEYVIDCGNDNKFGQVFLGNKENKELRIPYEKYPALIKGKENNKASCSLAEALEKQDLFINQVTATYALNLIWNLLRNGGTRHSGYYINLESGQTQAIPVKA